MRPSNILGTVLGLMLLAWPVYALATPAENPTVASQGTQHIPKVEVIGGPEPEDFARKEKTPIQKMRERLDKVPPRTNFSVREYVGNDGIRKAQIETISGISCLEERRGHVDFSGLNKDFLGKAMRPATKDCR